MNYYFKICIFIVSTLLFLIVIKDHNTSIEENNSSKKPQGIDDKFEDDEDYKEEKIVHLLDTHAYIHNTYYYQDSKSLGKNAIAMVLSMNQRTAKDLTKLRLKIVGSNDTNIVKSKGVISLEKRSDKCEYVFALALSNTVDNLKTLEIESNNVKVQVPFKPPRTVAPKPVIFCIAPQFVAEEWQTFLTQVHVSNRFGAHVHIYLTSIIESFYNLMLAYEKEGYITIDHWLTMKFSRTLSSYKDPNANIEWRGQTAAQTDCLLQYKESAQFVGFFDMDDLLFPYGYDNYLDEFENAFRLRSKINGIYYVKYDFRTIKTNQLNLHTVRSVITNAVNLTTTDRGKIVVRPELYNSTWIHYSINAQNAVYYNSKGEKKRMSRKEHPYNGIFHLRHLIMTDYIENGAIPMAVKSLSTSLLSDKILNEIDEDLERMKQKIYANKIERSLPENVFYKDIVFDCYNKTFYWIRLDKSIKTIEFCLNAYNCDLPQREDLKCYHSDASYHSGPPMYPFTFHYATNPYFSPKIGCYQ